MEPTFKPGVKEQLKAGEYLIVELGPGEQRGVKGAVTFDILDHDSVDVVCDLSKGLPLDDGSVDELHSYHFLEHVDDLQRMMQETARVLKPGGRAIGSVPHFANPYFYSDYTHQKFFGLYSFGYFISDQSHFRREVPLYSEELPFQVEELKLIFKSPFKERRWFKRALTAVFNMNSFMKEFHEENLCYILPAYEISFILRKT